jgi:hypothetical protein
MNSGRSAFDVAILRPTAKEWLPLVGPEYADQIAKSTLWRMLRLPVVLLALIPINVLRFVETVPWQIFDICLIVAVVVVGTAFPLVTRAKRRAIASQMASDLDRMGTKVASNPDLRAVESFLNWCEIEGVSADRIRDLGRTQSGGEYR